MEIIRARHSGFCMGVRRAVNMAFEALSSGKNVYTLGPLIHNTRVLEQLEKQGVKILKEEEEIDFIPPESIIIIRAHGVAPQLERAVNQGGSVVLDATCPHVKESQNIARELAEKGYHIFLAGEKNHGEIISIRSYVEEAASISIIIANPKEAEIAACGLYKDGNAEKTALIGQTTISRREYNEIGENIKKYFPDLEIIETICNATTDRQEALLELYEQIDAFIIAGSRESANTRRLFSLAQELGKPCWLVEKPEDIPIEIKSYNKIGLSAGASTPEDFIREIEESMKLLLITYPHLY